MVTVRNLGVTVTMLMEKLKEFCNDYDEMSDSAFQRKDQSLYGKV